MRELTYNQPIGLKYDKNLRCTRCYGRVKITEQIVDEKMKPCKKDCSACAYLKGNERRVLMGDMEHDYDETFPNKCKEIIYTCQFCRKCPKCKKLVKDNQKSIDCNYNIFHMECRSDKDIDIQLYENRDVKMNFGKYKGKSLLYIARRYPDYVFWLSNNLKGNKICNKLLTVLRDISH